MKLNRWTPPTAVLRDDWMGDHLTADLEESVRIEERSIFDALAGGTDSELVLFGAGNLGRRVLAGLRRIGVEPLVFIDNNAAIHGSLVDGLEVLSPEAAATRYGATVVVVTTIWTPLGTLAHPKVARQMAALGSPRVVPFVPLFWKYQEEFLPNFCLDAPHKLFADAESVRAAYRILADDESRAEFRLQLSYLLSMMDGVEVSIPPDREWYFPRNIIELSTSEVFVDCGAYDGDTISSFLLASGAEFKAIVAFEPDPAAHGKLLHLVQALEPGVRDRISIDQRAVGAETGELRFEGGGTPGSRISESGALLVQSVALDDALGDLAPTFIKMDIEGAEIDALLGASGVIAASRPILAVCVYHLQSHLFRVPLLISSLCPDYTLFVRRQGLDGDLVCFAIPNERLRS